MLSFAYMVTFDDSRSDTRIADLRAREEEQVIQMTAPKLGFEYINLQGYTINPEAIAAIPEEKAKEAEIVGFELHRNTLSEIEKTGFPTASSQLRSRSARS